MRKMHLLSMTRLPRDSRGGRVAIEKCKLDTKRERHTMRWQQCSLTGTTRSRMTCTYEVLARFLTSFSEFFLAYECRLDYLAVSVWRNEKILILRLFVSRLIPRS